MNGGDGHAIERNSAAISRVPERGGLGDAAVAVARRREDVIVGEEIVRHRLATRIIHWTTASFFFAALFTGIPIWSPIFGWMAPLFGGLTVCRWLHPLTGIAFSAAMTVMFFHWLRDMILERSDRAWFGPKLIAYMRYRSDDSDVGKFNGGQKLFFWAAALGSISLLVSGFVMWWPEWFPVGVREASILLHDITFILFAVAIVGHIYLGTAAEPGTFRSMIRGTVTRPWARLHHPRWYREVSDDAERQQ